MKSLRQYIKESFKIGRNKMADIYNYYPETRDELQKIIMDRVKDNPDEDIIDLNDIDVSKITNMSGLFLESEISVCNFDVSKWDVSNVRFMARMFYGCEKFNCDLSNWDVSSVTDMNNMFFNCKIFDGDLSGWDVSNLISAEIMFGRCEEFTGKGIDTWNPKKLRYGGCMFYGCYKFDQNLENWNTKNFTDIQGMFCNCVMFKGKGLEKWDTINIQNMEDTFADCFEFNPDISKWNTENLENINQTFLHCKKFDCDLNNWAIGKINDEKINRTFDGCKKSTVPDWYEELG